MKPFDTGNKGNSGKAWPVVTLVVCESLGLREAEFVVLCGSVFECCGDSPLGLDREAEGPLV